MSNGRTGLSSFAQFVTVTAQQRKPWVFGKVGMMTEQEVTLPVAGHERRVGAGAAKATSRNAL